MKLNSEDGFEDVPFAEERYAGRQCVKGLYVDLYAARLPPPFSFAEHYWLLIGRDDSIDRWEVWQEPGGDSWGHLHRNLLTPTQSVSRRPSRFVRRWQGGTADELAKRIEASPTQYPWLNRYHYWPGPNSNTYVQWILGQSYQLGWRGFGRAYWGLRSARQDPFVFGQNVD
ncbi:MAG: DUF3750 domain-containing protein [Pirellulaceae bacterium]|nr:DUF3750 domain-containing protein [Pirellulaceae bacterium]